jgi:hypothetical protein
MMGWAWCICYRLVVGTGVFKSCFGLLFTTGSACRLMDINYMMGRRLYITNGNGSSCNGIIFAVRTAKLAVMTALPLQPLSLSSCVPSPQAWPTSSSGS